MEEKMTLTTEELGDFQTYYGIISHVSNKISNIIQNVKPATIETNIKIGAFLQDSDRAMVTPIVARDLSNIPVESPYLILNFDGVDVYVNPHMRWDDTKLMFMNESKDVIHKLEIEDPNNYLM
jgi:hypothetical protein